MKLRYTSIAALLIILMLSISLTVRGIVYAAGEVKTKLKFIFFPVDLPGKFPPGEWKPMTLGEVENALKQTQQRQPVYAQLNELSLYLIRNGNGLITGTVRLEVQNNSNKPELLSLGTTSLLLENLQIDGKNIIAGNNIAGGMVLEIPAGKSTINGKAVHPFKSQQGFDELTLNLPQCINTRITFETSPREMVQTSPGIARKLDTSTDQKGLWTISAGGRQELVIKIFSKTDNENDQQQNHILIDKQTTWNISGSQTGIVVDLKPEIIGQGVDELKFKFPEELVMQSVSLASGGSLNYTLTPLEKDSLLSIKLPETTPEPAPLLN